MKQTWQIPINKKHGPTKNWSSHRDHFGHAPNKWEMMLHCNILAGRIHKIIPDHNTTYAYVIGNNELDTQTYSFLGRLVVCIQAPSSHSWRVACYTLEPRQPTLINKPFVTWDIFHSCSFTDLLLNHDTFLLHTHSSNMHIPNMLLRRQLWPISHFLVLEFSLTSIEFRDRYDKYP